MAGTSDGNIKGAATKRAKGLFKNKPPKKSTMMKKRVKVMSGKKPGVSGKFWKKKDKGFKSKKI